MFTGLAYSLQVPIDPDEAHKRKLPANLAKLLVCALGAQDLKDTDSASALGKCILEWTTPGESVFACPLVPYLSERAIERFLSKHCLVNDRKRVGRDHLIRCGSADAVASILSECTSEMTVFIISRSDSTVRETLVFVQGYPEHYDSMELPFMRRLGVHGGFIFSAEGHASLEVFGTQEFVTGRCLPPLLKGKGVRLL